MTRPESGVSDLAFLGSILTAVDSPWQKTAAVTWWGIRHLLHEGEDAFLTDPHFGQQALLPTCGNQPNVVELNWLQTTQH